MLRDTISSVGGKLRGGILLCVGLSLVYPVAPGVSPKQTIKSDLTPRPSQQQSLIPPVLLKREELQAGNPLATYAAMLDLESQYVQSPGFADFYRETRFNFEEFMGFPLAGVQAMSLPSLRTGRPINKGPFQSSTRPRTH